jgi:hypothetical protein
MSHSTILSKHKLNQSFTLSVFIATLVAVGSLAGLFLPSVIYPGEELRRAFLANDVVNLFIGLPTLVFSMWAARKGSLVGLLFWPGALFYVTYNSIAYAVAMPLTLPFVINLALVILSVYTIYSLLSSMDKDVLHEQFKGKIHERFIGGVLVGFGFLFFLLAASKVAGFISGSATSPWTDVSVQIADLLVTPFWVIGGVFLWQRKGFGYVSGAGLLFQASMLFIGLLVFFILQPLVANTPYPVSDFVVVFVMGLVCFIPFGLFVRGIAAK